MLGGRDMRHENVSWKYYSLPRKSPLYLSAGEENVRPNVAAVALMQVEVERRQAQIDDLVFRMVDAQRALEHR